MAKIKIVGGVKVRHIFAKCDFFRKWWISVSYHDPFTSTRGIFTTGWPRRKESVKLWEIGNSWNMAFQASSVPWIGSTELNIYADAQFWNMLPRDQFAYMTRRADVCRKVTLYTWENFRGVENKTRDWGQNYICVLDRFSWRAQDICIRLGLGCVPHHLWPCWSRW